MKNMINILSEHAINRPNHVALTFIEDSGKEGSLTYAQLHNAASSLAAKLEAANTDRTPVAIMIPQGLNYIVSFFGCLYAGLVAVPLYPPGSSNHADRVIKVVRDCHCGLALTTEKLHSLVAESCQEVTNFQVLAVDNLWSDDIESNAANTFESVAADSLPDTAFLQYTSGSTGNPKGVMISHGNIIANLDALIEATSVNEHDVFCNWIPLFHDLGLITAMMLPLYMGAHSILMSPGRFIKKPLHWLSAISRFRATTCGAPNFAYNYCIEKVRDSDLDALDLSSWRIAYNAAEPIDVETLAKFSDKFASAGFVNSYFYPAYGMAEATVYIASGTPGSESVSRCFDAQKLENNQAQPVTLEHHNSRPLVACGKVQSRHDLRIVDPQTHEELKDGDIGEIWFSGPSVAAGYWGDETKTTETFNRNIKGHQSGGFMRTGDLGFKLDEQLYIAGRLKDILIVNGRNFYPQDLEKTCSTAWPDLIKGGTVAFESLGSVTLVQEVKRTAIKTLDFEQAKAAIRNQIFEQFQIYVSDIKFVRAGLLPKTSSGKVQRRLVKQKCLNNTMDALQDPRQNSDAHSLQNRETCLPETQVQKQLAELWQELLTLEDISIKANFFELGGTSLLLNQMINLAAERHGYYFQVKDVFDNPSIAELATLIEATSQNKSSHTLTLTKQQGLTETALSATQFRIWFAERMAPNSSKHLLCRGVQLTGHLEQNNLEQALLTLSQRHELLRAQIITQSEQPFLRIREGYTVPLEVTQAADDTEAQALIESFCQAAIHLDDTCLCQVFMVSVSDTQHYLYLKVHHIIADGWSLVTLFNELMLLCRSTTDPQSELASLPKNRVNFLDFGHWQQRFLDSDDATKQEAFWKDYLQDCQHHLTLPALSSEVMSAENSQCHQAESGSDNLNSVILHQAISPEVQERLGHIAKKAGGSLFNIIHSALLLVLKRLTGNDDINIGVPLTGRNQAGLQNIVGPFVTNLPVRSHIDESQSFRNYLDGQIRNLADVQSNQDIPLERIIELTHAKSRQTGSTPLFQIFLNMLSLPDLALSDTQLAAEMLPENNVDAIFDFTIYISSSQDGISLRGLFDQNIYQQDTIQQVLHQVVYVLEQVAQNPDVVCRDVSLRSPKNVTPELPRLTDAVSQEWSGPVHQLFANTAARQPSATAISYQNRQWSYAEVESAANHYAAILQERGVKKGEVVPILAQRNDFLVIATLAVLKSGAAFCMLQSETPELFRAQLAQINARFILSVDDSLVVDSYSAGSDIADLDIIAVCERPANTTQTRVSESVSQQELAYIAFTSGSTGKPKVIKGSHSALSAYIPWYNQEFEVTEQDTWAMVSGLVHDPLQRDMFHSLCAGAKLSIPGAEDYEAQRLLPWLSQQQISNINLTPSLVAYFFAGSDIQLPLLRNLFMGGEKLSGATVTQIRKHAPEANIINLYGATESCRALGFYLLPGKQPEQTLDNCSVIPVGKGVADTQLVLLNDALQLCGVGEIGQIAIRSPHLTLGYHNESIATRKVFLQNPMAGSERDTLYLTGDYGRYLLDGNAVVEGRQDRQIKIRGYRVELDHIETQLQACTYVNQAFVNNRVSASGDELIVAYVVVSGESVSGKSADEQETSSQELLAQVRQEMRRKLPEYMQPGEYCVLAELPVNANGKIDAVKLAKAVSTDIQERTLTAPCNPTEQKIYDYWSSLLGDKPFCVKDAFFDIGGHSLLVTKTIAWLKTEFAFAISYQDFLAHSSVTQLAEKVIAHQRFTSISGASEKTQKIVL